MGQHGGLFLQLVQRPAGTVEIKRICQHEKGFLFSHDDIPYSTGSNPLLFFPLPARQELPANRERGGITSPFPAQQELPPRGLPPSQNVLEDEGWGSGGGEKGPFGKGLLLPSPGFFIYSAYFTILGSSMIW